MYLLYGKLSKSTTTAFLIGRLLITNHFGNISNLFFPIKSSYSNKIALIEKDLIPEKNDDIAETFNGFFTSVLSKLNISCYQDPFLDGDQTENRIGHPILRIIEQFKKHPSIIAINNQKMDRQFSFQEITKSEINQEMLNLIALRPAKNQIFQ